jgi:glyoxylase-like metal-dependent hydrolase (beta-lactamase superfamily II)
MDSLLPDVPEYTPEALAEILESGEPVQIMDVRAPDRVAQGRIDLIPDERFHNIRGSELMHRMTPESTGLDPNLPVAVVCGFGKDSKILAFHLGRMGMDARTLAGGMVAWMRFTLPRPIDRPDGLDRLVQFDRIGSGCLGYVLVSDGEALIIDTPLFFEAYLKAIEEAGAKIVAVADTHVHADYVSGAPKLSREQNIPYYLHPADAVYPYDGTPGKIPFHAISDGDCIRFGQAELTVMHTPGHTEGSVSYLLEDRIAFTGDFLFVESIGRPDLGGKAKEWASELWDSVSRARAEWSPSALILPAHYATQRERRPDGSVGADFGSLQTENEALSFADGETFEAWILENEGAFPEAYRKIKAINVGLAPVVESEVEELEMGRNECALGGTHLP